MYGYRRKNYGGVNRRGNGAEWLAKLRRNRWAVLICFALLLAGVQWLQQRLHGPAGGEASGRARLVDGDSFHLNQDEVRLVGIDAPEGRQTCTRGNTTWSCGEAARQELARLIGGQPVTCKADERDQHGRLLAVCTAGGRDLNRDMVASGMAVAYGRYEREESEARGARRGLWSGEFQRPRDWRRTNGHGRD